VHKGIGQLVQKYPIIAPGSGLKSLVRKAHVVHFHASVFIRTGADLGKKWVVAQHGGSTLRMEPKIVNKFFNSIVDYSIIHTPDLLQLGCKNEVWLSLPVDTDLLKAGIKFRNRKKIIVGHFPSTTSSKGHASIMTVVNAMRRDKNFKDKFEYVGVPVQKYRVIWAKNIERIKQCDIIIDACLPIQSGRRYGEWANAALEAASLGKIVITHSGRHEWYLKKFGSCPLFIANSPKEIKTTLKKLLRMDRKKLLVLREQTRAWAVQKHSIQAYAQRLWDEVYSNFFEKKGGKIAWIPKK